MGLKIAMEFALTDIRPDSATLNSVLPQGPGHFLLSFPQNLPGSVQGKVVTDRPAIKVIE